MGIDPNSGETTTLGPESQPATPPRADLVVALTILYHPDGARIGQQALLSSLLAGRSVRLSRLVPKFGPPGEPPTAALHDGHISRQPIFIEGAAPDAVVLHADEAQTRVVLDGVPLAGTMRLAREQLEHGVVLELSERVSLLLHHTRPKQPSRHEQLGLIGEATELDELRARIRRVAPHNVPVLIRGESGVGKELVASAIHQLSPRAAQPLISINMAAIPSSMAVASLFGHAKGAFTGAVAASRGYFGSADGGTLFLDEIGDTPLNVQSQLLRVLECGEIQPVGCDQPERVDVRLIAATDADLAQSVGEGGFRQALLQRLGGYVLSVPPLRARRQDIGLLLMAFLGQELARLGRADRLLTPAAGTRAWLPCWLVTAAARHDWPGNVRELRNAARQLAIDWAEAPEILRDSSIEQLFPLDEAPRQQQIRRERGSLDHISEDGLIATLKKHAWQPAIAATELGISRTSIYALMRKCPRIHTAAELDGAAISEALKACGGDVGRAAQQLSVSEPGLKRRIHHLGL